VIGYFSTRSHLIGEVQNELRARADQFLLPHPAGRGGPGGGPGGGAGGCQGPPDEGAGSQIPGAPPFGGAQGYFQVVLPDGTICRGGQLPVSKPVLSIARNGSGSFFSDARVRGTHVEIYAVWDADDQHVVQVALPLTAADSVLHGLLLPYGLLIGGGVLLALLLGLAISRSALRPIDRFVRQTETVTSSLDRPIPLEETGPVELRRLAASFNQTLDALERSIEAQRHLIADASHELRTPIAALRSNIQIFLESDRLPEQERVELQESILAELDELTQIVGDVVALARGAAPADRDESIELDTIVREAVERTRRRAPALPRGDQPRRQRSQVEPRGGRSGDRRAGWGAVGARPRPRLRGGGPAARIRSVLPGQQRPADARLRPRPGDRQAGGRGARRERRSGKRQGRRGGGDGAIRRSEGSERGSVESRSIGRLSPSTTPEPAPP
jgi:two-component system sensor histidine kinase MprB